MDEEYSALHDSVDHLRRIVDRLEPSQLRQPAYPVGWSIADVLSHIGSGAVILRRRFDDIVGGRETEGEFSQSVWDEWSAKDPDAQAADALVADAALLAGLDALDERHRGEFRFTMGPMDLNFMGFVGLRLNEHVLHTWDIEVAGQPAAVLPPGATLAVIDNLELVARGAGRPTGSVRTVQVRTTGPERGFTISLGTDSFELIRSETTTDPDLEIPSEAFIRLVYGRLDPDHTPPVARGAVLEELRKAFPGL
jgi:uncharacterized protein (TIGR03083 family)